MKRKCCCFTMEEQKSTKTLNRIFLDIFESRVKAKIYLYLLRREHDTSENIITYTGFYPSTVRKALFEMFEQNIVYRKKVKKNSKGNNPYTYYPVSPIKILRKYTKNIESKFNSVINKDGRYIKIKIEMGKGDKA
ncbi:MAG: TrmB family transcriptional regulator [Thermoplasmata archaeon]|nr:MAG: TrmB family transcriptional regulator [Thermoplasmata archaeon]